MVDWTRVFFCTPRARPRADEAAPNTSRPSDIRNNIPLAPISRPAAAHIEDGGRSQPTSSPPRTSPPSLDTLRDNAHDDVIQTATSSAAAPPPLNTNWLTARPIRRRTEDSLDASNPVAVLTSHRLTHAIREFRKSLDDLAPSPDQDPAWHQRLQHTRYMLDNLDVMGSLSGAQGLVYSFQNALAGVMVVTPNRDDTRLSVQAFVTHPLSETVGVTLGEAAVNHSQALGKGGRLDGLPLDDGVKQLYLAMGCHAEGDRLVLDPMKSDKWEMAEGRWRMKKYAGTVAYGDVASMNRSESEKAALKRKA